MLCKLQVIVTSQSGSNQSKRSRGFPSAGMYMMYEDLIYRKGQFLLKFDENCKSPEL